MTESLYFLLLLCAAATYVWRVLGVFVGRKLDPDSALFDWLNCVAYALLAGLMARVMVFPVGLLAETLTASRFIAMVAGFVVFYALGRNFLVATFVSSIGFYLLLRFSEGVL